MNNKLYINIARLLSNMISEFKSPEEVLCNDWQIGIAIVHRICTTNKVLVLFIVYRLCHFDIDFVFYIE